MKYNGQVLRIDNISRILKDFSIDIQDEVRSAILDQVNIEDYLEECKSNPFRLQQIRLALKEGVDKIFFKLDGGTLYKARKMLKSNLISSQSKKLLEQDASIKGYSVMLDLDALGYDLSGYDFSIIPDEILGEFKWGISHKADLRKLCNGKVYSKQFVRACSHLSISEKEIDKFIDENWLAETVIRLSKYCDFKHYDKLVEVLTNLSIPEYVDCFAECLEKGIDNEKVYEKDEYGYEIFMPSQLEFIAEMRGDGFSIEGLLDPRLSLEEMYIIKGLEREKTGRRLKGVLGNVGSRLRKRYNNQ